MSVLTEVQVASEPIERYRDLIGDERTEQFLSVARRAREGLGDRTVWNINSTAAGGGVAEMLGVLLAYVRGAGIDTRWLVIRGDEGFFQMTKRLHNLLHGAAGDGGSLGEVERRRYERVLQVNAESLSPMVEAGDIVLLHDPQTAGLAPALRDHGALVVWRCHIGTDEPNEHTEHGQSFLRPYLEDVPSFVFSREAHIHPWMPRDRVMIIPPSIDPFAPKNQQLEPEAIEGILRAIRFQPGDDATGRFRRRDGSWARVARPALYPRRGHPPDAETPVIVQVSRWDRLKDMTGVLRGFAEARLPDAHLALVGPDVTGVTDDPEGAEVLQECIELFDRLPDEVTDRVHLVCLPMDDAEENAAMVNALQRSAATVTQKSLQEGFGLTVTEAMLKGRAVVASAVGGITDQIVDGEHGLLVPPEDLDAFGGALGAVLGDADRAAELGEAARRRAINEFVGDRHLRQYAELLQRLLGADELAAE